MTQTVTVQQFGGLDLRSDPPEATGAVDGLNFDLDQAGRVRSRDGSTRLGSSTTSGTSPQWQVPINFDGTKYLLVFSATTSTTYLDRFTTAGARTAVGNWGSAGYYVDSVRVGTPTSERIYTTAAPGTGLASITIRRYDGTSLNTPLTMGAPAYLGLLPTSNRVAGANFALSTSTPSGANGSRSTVFFSDPGAPETFADNNYVLLQPGDGEQIVALETWRDELYAFKQSTLFIFSGTSTGSTGNPIFNYRTVRLPTFVDLPSATKRPVVAGTDGIYFFAGNAIYRTNGGDPVVISDAIEPILRRVTSTDLNYGEAEISLSWADERLYVRYLPQTGGVPLVLIYDARTKQWLLWQFASTGAIASNVVSWQGRPYYVRSDQQIAWLDPAATNDNGTAIASRYQSGWSDLGSPYDKRLREIAAWGSGSPTLTMFSDRGSTDASAATVTLGTAPTVTRGVQHKSRSGREFSWKISAASGAWSVSSLELFIADQRVN